MTRWSQEPAARGPKSAAVRTGMWSDPCAQLGHPYYLPRSHQGFGTSRGFWGCGGVHTEGQGPFVGQMLAISRRAGCNFQPRIHLRNMLGMCTSERSSRKEPEAWREPQFSPLLPGREWKLRDVGGLSIADATSQAVARDLALRPQQETSLLQKDVGCDKQLQRLQTGLQWAQPAFVPVGKF